MKPAAQRLPTKSGLAPRPEVLAVPPAVHGGIDRAELERLGIDARDVLDFSANGNPYGPSPAVREAIAQVRLHDYPDREALTLRRLLAQRLDLSPDNILVGNGATELLSLAAQAFLRPGDPVLVLGPTFAEYARVAALAGGRVHTWQARAAEGFAFVAAEVEHLLAQLRPRIAFVCNPNNPTGIVIAVEVLGQWARRFPRALFVVDESYRGFVTGLPSAGEGAGENVLVVRSLTKDHALAGLRLGYAAGSPEVLRWLAHVQPPWSVNALAQAAGVASLKDSAHLEQSLARLAAAREELAAGLVRLGLEVLPSRTHFFLVRVGDGAALRRQLLKRHILVRDGASWGLKEYVRIATRRPEENARLLAALREVKG
jgi:threonine-phosphate decarboxylase